MKIGERIRTERIAAGMSQKRLVEQCGMAVSTIRNYESGTVNPGLKSIVKIAKAIGAKEPMITAFEWMREDMNDRMPLKPNYRAGNNTNLEKLRTLPEEDLAAFLDRELSFSTPIDWNAWLREEAEG